VLKFCYVGFDENEIFDARPRVSECGYGRGGFELGRWWVGKEGVKVWGGYDGCGRRMRRRGSGREISGK